MITLHSPCMQLDIYPIHIIHCLFIRKFWCFSAFLQHVHIRLKFVIDLPEYSYYIASYIFKDIILFCHFIYTCRNKAKDILILNTKSASEVAKVINYRKKCLTSQGLRFLKQHYCNRKQIDNLVIQPNLIFLLL